MKLFHFRGGVHPLEHKHSTADSAIRCLPIPKYLYIPLLQHIGVPAAAQVKVGEKVLKGQQLAHAQGTVSAAIHAPTSGVVLAISDRIAPHPSGLPVTTITLETDGLDQWIELEPISDPFALSPTEISERVGAAGIVGMGGAAFPSSVKLGASQHSPVHTLIINGAECEPYLTCDDRLMRERSIQAVEGIRIMQYALKAEKSVIVIEDNKRLATEAIAAACKAHPDVSVVNVPTRYPMGSEKQMIQTVTGREVPAGGLGADIGVMVHNIGTAYAVYQALRFGKPLISRVVTVSGEAVTNPKNLEVPIGTPISELFDFCGGFTQEPARLLMGGPMMGQVLPSIKVPVVKGLNGVLALTQQEIASAQAGPCIRCGRCISACPIGLLPLEMAARVRGNDFTGALGFGLIDCIACGSCSYICPSHIPLVHYFNYAKGEMAQRQRMEQKATETRKLVEARKVRLNRLKRERVKAAAATRRQDTPQTSTPREKLTA
jgi:electron transport complex protein RnfC